MKLFVAVLSIALTGLASAAPKKESPRAAAKKVQREVAGLRKKLKKEKCPSEDADANIGSELTLYRDKKGRVRRSVEVAGSEDSVSTYDSSYDESGILRAVKLRQGRVGTRPIKDELFFDVAGAVIWSITDPDEQVLPHYFKHLQEPGAAKAPTGCQASSSDTPAPETQPTPAAEPLR
jgi:hypothetical protein